MVEGGQTTQHSHHVRTVASAEDYPLERLQDPCNDRTMADVPRPPRYPMSIQNLYHTVDGMLLFLFILQPDYCVWDYFLISNQVWSVPTLAIARFMKPECMLIGLSKRILMLCIDSLLFCTNKTDDFRLLFHFICFSVCLRVFWRFDSSFYRKDSAKDGPNPQASHDWRTHWEGMPRQNPARSHWCLP